MFCQQLCLFSNVQMYPIIFWMGDHLYADGTPITYWHWGCARRCAGCYSAKTQGGRCPRRAPVRKKPRPYSSPWEDAMKRPDAAEPVVGARGLVKDKHVMDGYPHLVQFLSDDRWDDGGTRTPGSLTLFIEEGIWKACLNDRDAQASLYVSGDTTSACMKSLESRLAGTTVPDWRVWKKKGKRS